MLRPAEPRAGATSAPRHDLLESPNDGRGLLPGIIQSVGGFLGFGNDQGAPKDTGNGGASSTVGTHEPTSVKPSSDRPSFPAQAPPASYPAPGGGGQGERPTSSAPVPPASVSPATSSSAGNAPGPAPHSTTTPAAMDLAPTQDTAPQARDSQHVPDVYSGTAPPAISFRWPSISAPVSGPPSPTQPPFPGAQIGHAKRFPLAAAVVLGFVVVSALFWAVWLARRRAYPEFASVCPKRTIPVPNPFTHPRDDKEDDPFDGVLCVASTTFSMASTMSV